MDKQIYFIRHRCNQLNCINDLPRSVGVEIDLRSDINKENQLVVTHDPWTVGTSFDIWLDEFISMKISGPIILNTKEDGLEDIILDQLRIKNIVNEFFFLDTALPTLVKRSQNNKETFFAVRNSIYEPYGFTSQFTYAKWIWLDCFDGVLPNIESVEQLSKNYSICLVSPELQQLDIRDVHKFPLELFQYVDAVCSKNYEFWSQFVCLKQS